MTLTFRSPRMAGPVAAAVLGLIGLVSHEARADQRAVTLSKETYVYRQPDANSEVLGHLREGKQLKVEVPGHNGWFAVTFSRPVKGTNTGYILGSSIQGMPQTGGPGANPRTRVVRRRRIMTHPNWLEFGLSFHMTSPSDVQTALGEPTGGLTITEYSLTFGHFTSPNFAIEFRGFYYSASKDTTNTSGGNYSVKGEGLTFGGDYAFIRNPNFTLAGGAGVGVSLNSAGNTGTAFVFNTSSVMAFPINLKVLAKYWFGDVGVSGELGYQIESLSQIPFSPPSATSSTTQVTANWSESGLFIHLGLAYQF